MRPGIDTTQFQAAIAQAEIDYLQTERTCQQKIIELTRLTGMDTRIERIVLTDTLFNPGLFILTDTALFINQHPYYQNLEAQQKITEAGLKEIQKSWVPQLDIWGNVYARGSGIDAMGKSINQMVSIYHVPMPGLVCSLAFPYCNSAK